MTTNPSGFGPLGAMDRSRTLVGSERKSRRVKTPGPTEQARSYFSLAELGLCRHSYMKKKPVFIFQLTNCDNVE